MEIPELIKILEEATKFEQQDKLQEAYDSYNTIVKDPNTPKQLLMTAEKRLNGIITKLQGASEVNGSVDIIPNVTEKVDIISEPEHIYEVDPYVLIPIPQIDGKMPIRRVDYDRLKEGIKQRGITVPIEALPDFRLLCGYNRVKIAKELGLKTVPVIFKNIDNHKLYDYAMKDNIERRHLTADQIIEFVSEATTQESGRRKKNSRNKTVGEIANTLGVSERTIQRAKKFVKKIKDNPQLKGQSIRAVIEGESTNKFMTKFNYIIGVGDPEQEMIHNTAEIIKKIYELDPRNGDQIKVITAVYIRRRT